MAKFENTVNVHDSKPVENWISQIKAGNTTYDIATHHSIKFVEGGEETTWNGLSDLTVVIPTVEDIVQTPIEFAGTVDETGKITWNDSTQTDPEVGNLVFITKDCTFENEACEAGDMAIYAGDKWNIVSGENQVSIVTDNGTTTGNVTTIAVGPAKSILSIEGKELSLTLDYKDLNDNHLVITPGDVEYISFDNVKVGSKKIKLTQGTKDTKTIGKEETFDLATSLKDGSVNFTGAENLVNSVTFGTFNEGAFPVYSKNNLDIKLDIAGGTLSKGNGNDFITDVTVKNVSFTTATSSDANKFNMATGLTSKTGASFFNGITTTTSGGDFTVFKPYIPEGGVSAKFVTGLGTGSDVVTEITAGSFELTTGDILATGFTTEGSSGDVISSVRVSASTTDVFSSAKVDNHVLSFGTTSVHNGDFNTTCSYKSLTKTGFTYTPTSYKTKGFTTSGFTKDSDIMYKFNTGTETTYELKTELWKIATPELDITTGSYDINHNNMKATVKTGTFYNDMTEGTLPSLSAGSVTHATLVGSVATELTTTPKKVNVLNANTIDLPGEYTLEDNASEGIEVGVAGELASKVATVDLEGYITGVEIVEKKNS